MENKILLTFSDVAVIAPEVACDINVVADIIVHPHIYNSSMLHSLIIGLKKRYPKRIQQMQAHPTSRIIADTIQANFTVSKLLLDIIAVTRLVPPSFHPKSKKARLEVYAKTKTSAITEACSIKPVEVLLPEVMCAIRSSIRAK